MTKNEVAVLRSTIEKMEPEYAKTLPSHISPEKFVRTTITAVSSNPALLKADRNSLMAACMKAAQDGLILDGREAALVMFKTTATYMPMVAGIMKKARNSGEISTLIAEVVYVNDTWEYFIKDGKPHMFHEPLVFGDRGDILGVYAAAVLKDGGVMTEVLSLEAVEQVRSVSRAKNAGPWVTWWEEMAKKTAIRRLSKRLPSSSDIEQVIHADDDLFMPPVDITPKKKAITKKVEEPQEKPDEEKEPEVAEKKTTKAAEAVSEASKPDEDGVVDAEFETVQNDEEEQEEDIF